VRLVDGDAPGPRREYVGYGRRPPKVLWPGDAKLALNIAVNLEEGSEYSQAAGDGRNESLGEIPFVLPPEHRDLHVESVFEYGSRAGVWRLLRLFDEYGVKTTFYCCGVALERNPEVGAWIGEAGHEPCSHGWRWEEHWLLDRERERERIGWAIDAIERACGERPVGWLSRFCASVNTRELLVEEGGFLYDSDAFNDDLPYFVDVGGKRHLVLPYTDVYNDGRYVMAQGFASPSDFFDACRRGLDELLREGRAGFPKMMSIGLHPRWAGQACRVSALRELIEYALAQEDVWLVQRREVARWWIAHHEEFGR
jgi:peptidoglycan/xylan/chitin deacetylase (PgdA/CDA1 family)